jgi:uncharacterized protein (TIGR00290 family)
MPEPVLMCWSGGKDSAMALYDLLTVERRRVAALLTTVTEGFDRISMHGVRRELLERQAGAIGLPLHQVTIPPQCVNAVYESRMEEARRVHFAGGIREVVFGDIFLEDLRVYRENNLAKLGMRGVFPIWKRDTRELVATFLQLGFRAIVVCVDLKVLPADFSGREINAQFLKDLPPDADPCGENGEFHSFVFDGPIFTKPVQFALGKKVQRDSFCFCDLIPTAEGSRALML